MARPFKKRRVHFVPDFYTFKPASIPKKYLKKIDLSLDELEAVRLADLLGLYQEEAARRMDVSRQTFGNILQSARNKVAQTLIEGAFLQIEEGIVDIGGERIYKCCGCNHEWRVEFGGERPRNCPELKRQVKQCGGEMRLECCLTRTATGQLSFWACITRIVKKIM